MQVKEAEALASLSSERDVLQSKVQGLEEAQEVLHSELATAQSDLATASSQANTHSMATERVRHCGVFLKLEEGGKGEVSPSHLYTTHTSLTHHLHTHSHIIHHPLITQTHHLHHALCSGPGGVAGGEGGVGEREGETRRDKTETGCS